MTDMFDPDDHAPLPSLMMPGLKLVSDGALGAQIKTEVEYRPMGIDKARWANPLAQNERDRLLDEELAYRNYPTSPKNAARAGWYAGLRYATEVTIVSLSPEQRGQVVQAIRETTATSGNNLSVDVAEKLLDVVFQHLKKRTP